MLAEDIQEFNEFGVFNFFRYSVTYYEEELVTQRFILVDGSELADTLESIKHVWRVPGDGIILTKAN